jgi:type I restriction enzyme S subunit
MVPEGWKIKALSDIAAVERGKFSARPRNDPQYYGGAIPFIQTGDVATSGGHITSYAQTLNERGLAVSRLFRKGTIFITIAANIGNAAIADFDTACPDSIVAVQPADGTSVIWLLHMLMLEQPKLDAYASQNAQKNINLETLRPLPILTPPNEEQHRIAAILSTWDTAITQMEKLVEAKRKLKNGLMQQFLTGKRRFPEFGRPAKQGQLPEDWKRVALGDIAQVISSNVDKKNHPNEKPVLLCNYLDVYNNKYISKHIDFMRATATNVEISKFSLKTEDVIITKDSETPDDIANAATVVEDLPGIICGYHLAILRPRLGVSGFFLGQLLMYSRIRYQFSRIANGVTRFGLNLSSIVEVPLWLPSHDEQVKIAKVLMKIDHEIDALVLLSNQLQEQKRGLMQKLLTGQLRVQATHRV